MQTGKKGKDTLFISHLQLKHVISKCSEWLVAHVNELERPHRNQTGETLKGPSIALLMKSNIWLLIHLLSLLSLGVPVCKSMGRKLSRGAHS